MTALVIAFIAVWSLPFLAVGLLVVLDRPEPRAMWDGELTDDA